MSYTLRNTTQFFNGYFLKVLGNLPSRICIFVFVIALSNPSNAAHVIFYPSDSTITSDSTRNNSLEKKGRKKDRSRVLSLNYRTLPKASQNYERFNLRSDFTDDKNQYNFNSEVQRHFDSDATNNGFSVQDQLQLLQNDINSPVDLTAKSNKETYYALLRANAVNVSSEKELNQLITSSSKEMMSNGMDDLSTDLLPFITLLMNEQHIYNYDENRAISTKPTAKGIVTSVDMLNTLGTLDATNKLGVCRDTHDMGLRIARNMYQVYLDEKFPGRNYDADDYLFLQAWVTPSSQHVTLVVVDPENPRDFHELDWGRVIEKTDQEGVEIGKMVGTAVRLWQYDESKDLTVAFNLVRSTWGAFFDTELLTADEQWQINGIYTPQYNSGTSYAFDVGKKGRSKAVVSAGMMNAREHYLSGTIRSGKHHLNLSRFVKYTGFASWQSMYIDDTKRKTETMDWVDWGNASNLITSIRYISDLTTKKFEIVPNLHFQLYAKSQIEAFLTMSYFRSDSEDFSSRLYKSGDGNVWTTWGGALSYESASKKFNTSLNYNDRSFLIPSEIRLLSPNPFVLLENATVVKSGRGIQSKSAYTISKGEFVLDCRFEQDAMKSKFIFSSLEFSTELKPNLGLYSRIGYFQQIDGEAYYWYAKNRVWMTTGVQLPDNKLAFNFTFENIGANDFTFGTSITKSF